MQPHGLTLLKWTTRFNSHSLEHLRLICINHNHDFFVFGSSPMTIADDNSRRVTKALAQELLLSNGNAFVTIHLM